MTSRMPNRFESRREFFRSLARYAVLGAMGLGGVRLARRRGNAGSAPHRCTGAGVCPACPAAGTCILPQAVSRRRAEGPDHD
jgi:hypothetical protein